ncbi:hypothetical protein [Amaricoccus sp.]|uniref:hypothetical protein n=1 Tax=Amaricoccus sp. TaxID=1872485 RepID=UPI0026363AFB|nr:hypothetical protein [Amaricoccus sp.]HRO10628.1 hypothetical protein [Amaricoccus sp.]
MFPFIEERIAYGRSIRQRASCLIEAYGAEARAEALRAAEEPGLAAAERSFWIAVAARVARQFGQRDALAVL